MADEPQNTQDEGAARVESPAAENEQEMLDEIQQRKIQEHQQIDDGAPDQPRQAYETDAPTEPAASAGGPQDALAGSPQPPQATGGVPASERPDEPAVATRPGPEDALDPRAANLGDYSEPGRTDDAIHMHHEAVPEEDLQPGGPRSRPIAQNQLAEEHLSGLEQTAEQIAASEDPGADAARARAEAEQSAQPGETRQAAAEEQPGAGEQA